MAIDPKSVAKQFVLINILLQRREGSKSLARLDAPVWSVQMQ